MTRLRTIGMVFRLALPKFGIAWMFVLLTSNFNRIAIYELGVAAVLITAMIGLHQFLSPFQIVFGRLSDRSMLLGYRRTSIMLLGAVVAGCIFLFLPAVALGMGRGELGSTLLGFALLILFGAGIAAHGDSHHALIADLTTERQRGGAVAFVWMFLIISTIASAIIVQLFMPSYDQATMQRLYNLTPLVVLGSALAGVLGLERRLTGAERRQAREQARIAAPAGNPLRAAAVVLRENRQARAFFGFVFLAIMAIFLQDGILEVFGAEVFGLPAGQTTAFTRNWGVGALLGMLGMGLVAALWAPSKKLVATLGGMTVALGLGGVAIASLTGQLALLTPALVLMGLGGGCFNVGALSMMMDMTVEGSRGLYMGLWGMAQAFGTGLAAIVGGALHTALIESGALAPGLAYLVIFGCEALLMVLAIGLLRTISVAEFRGLTQHEVAEGLALEAA